MRDRQQRMLTRARELAANPDARILAIETSCDETAVAILQGERRLLANCVYSQLDEHRRFGGVVPEEASRLHVAWIDSLIDRALAQAGLTLVGIDAVAVTLGPGLVGALLTGVSSAKALAYALDVPLIGVHHIVGHLCANRLQYPELEPPYVGLVVSGGHTHLYDVMPNGQCRLIGRTRDDASGEAFDKAARMLNLGYPGGPAIERAAADGDPKAFALPRAIIKDGPYDFSFSGLKTALMHTVRKLEAGGGALPVADLAASFQQAVIDALTNKAVAAAKERGSLAIAGGVASNSALHQALQRRCAQEGVAFYCPPPNLCTDNAAMIARAGYEALLRVQIAGLDANAMPMWSMEQWEQM